jgi:transposase
MLRARDVSVMPPDTQALGERVLRETDPYRVIGEQLADLVRDEEFADLYAPDGRHAVSPALLALVTLFQFLENVPDRQAAHQVVVRIDWKYALHLSLEDCGFDFSDLSHFRQRLLDHQADRRVFELLLCKIEAAGLVRKRGKQRTDSLAVLGAVRQLSRLETVFETLRAVVQAWDQHDPTGVPPELRARYLESRLDYQLSADEQAAEMRQIGVEGARVLALVDDPTVVVAPPEEVVGALRAVWEQRYHQEAGQVQLRADAPDATELIVTPHDLEVRAAKKRGKEWHGDKVHVTEALGTAGNFLTDITTANASSGDGEALPVIREQLADLDLLPAEHHVDAGYVSGQQLAASQLLGIELVGPPLYDTSPHAFKIADFVIDRAAQVAICPAGQRSVKWSPRTEPNGSTAVNIQFAGAQCAVCPLREQCTTSQSGRSLHLSAHYEVLQARRAEAQTPAFQERLHWRAGIEATLSELVRGHGLRRHRYRGEAQRTHENLLKGAACNLKRFVRALLRRAAPLPTDGDRPTRVIPPNPCAQFASNVL